VEHELESWITRSNATLEKMHRFPFLLIQDAIGINIIDATGKSYLDFTSGGQTSNLGHQHPIIMSAVRAQLEHTGLASFGWALNTVRIQFAEELKRITPGEQSEKMVGFCNTGSDATELSLRLATEYTSKPMVICHFGCYHGQPSMGALALNTSPHGRKYGVPQVPGVFYIPYPYCFRCLFKQSFPDCDFTCLDFFEYQIKTRVIPEEKVAAFFFEPVQVHGGVIILPDGYLARLADICQSSGILLIADEVTTGFGRTGKMFGIEHWNVKVDMIYMAKSIASGLSIGAIVANKDIMTSFKGGGTFSGNPVACAAGLASIRIIEEIGFLEQSVKSGNYLRKRLSELSPSHCSIGEIRGSGLLTGVELVLQNDVPATKETGLIIEKAAKGGLLMFPAGVYQNVLRLCPPLITQFEDIDLAVSIIEQAFK
jgi:4-aminobutyrate aminotransferase